MNSITVGYGYPINNPQRESYNMKNGKKREHGTCTKCGKDFSFLPRTDGEPQRNKCLRCKAKE